MSLLGKMLLFLRTMLLRTICPSAAQLLVELQMAAQLGQDNCTKFTCVLIESPLFLIFLIFSTFGFAVGSFLLIWPQGDRLQYSIDCWAWFGGLGRSGGLLTALVAGRTPPI
jgi:hypothetical protein